MSRLPDDGEDECQGRLESEVERIPFGSTMLVGNRLNKVADIVEVASGQCSTCAISLSAIDKQFDADYALTSLSPVPLADTFLAPRLKGGLAYT